MKVVVLNSGCKASSWFDAGEDVTVLALSVSGSGGSQYCLWSQKQNSVGLFPASDFAIVQSSVSRYWQASLDLNGNCSLAPAPWSEAGFWERYHDEEPTTVVIFETWKQKLEAES